MVLAAALCWSMPAAKAASRDVEAILAAMTVAEKVAMMHGAEDPLPRRARPISVAQAMSPVCRALACHRYA